MIMCACMHTKLCICMHHATCTMHHAPCTMQHAPCTMQHATCTMHHAPCTMQHAACSMQHVREGVACFPPQTKPCLVFLMAQAAQWQGQFQLQRHAAPMLLFVRGNSHTWGNIWKFSVLDGAGLVSIYILYFPVYHMFSMLRGSCFRTGSSL